MMGNSAPVPVFYYSTTAPSDIAAIEASPTVTNYEQSVRSSEPFNAPQFNDRHEVDTFVFTNNETGEPLLVDTQSSPKFYTDCGCYRGLTPGAPPQVDGYTAQVYIHDHPFPLSGPKYGLPQPSQADIDYLHGQKLGGIVISHDRNYYVGH